MFELIDTYTGLLLDVDLASVPRDEMTMIGSDRRMTREMSYGFIHALWWVRLPDGRSVCSVPPGAEDAVSSILCDMGSGRAVWHEELVAELKKPINAALQRRDLRPINRTRIEKVFACNGGMYRPHPAPDCRRLSEPAMGCAEDIHVPRQCLADGVAFGFVHEGLIVSAAYAHRTGIMADRVADIGVETTGSLRRHGLARAALSALVEDFANLGGEARYGCNPSNTASMATARSVGFVPYAESLILSAPPSE